MRARRCAAALVALALVACGDDTERFPERPAHPLLADLEPPPRNRAVRVPSEGPRAVPAEAPRDPGPGVLALREGRPLAELARERGSFEVEANRIRLTPAKGAPVELRLQLPEGLGTPRAAVGDGELRVTDRARPEGVQRHIALRDTQGLVVSEVWRSEPNPLVLELDDDLVLRQDRAAEPAADSEYAAAAVRLHQGGQVRELPVGEPVEVKTRTGPLRLFVATSQRFVPRDAADQYPPVYILRVFAVAE